MQSRLCEQTMIIARIHENCLEISDCIIYERAIVPQGEHRNIPTSHLYKHRWRSAIKRRKKSYRRPTDRWLSQEEFKTINFLSATINADWRTNGFDVRGNSPSTFPIHSEQQSMKTTNALNHCFTIVGILHANDHSGVINLTCFTRFSCIPLCHPCRMHSATDIIDWLLVIFGRLRAMLKISSYSPCPRLKLISNKSA